jgi:serine/threonine protein kinase
MIRAIWKITSKTILPPSAWPQRLAWISQLIDFVAACHDRKVLWFDIALRNILLADDMTIRAIDFANSTAVPLDADIDTTTSDGYTARVEVLRLTNAIYSISRRTKFQTDCVGEKEWLAMNTFPATEHLELGHIIRKAWGHEYSNVLGLRAATRSLQDGGEENDGTVGAKNTE